MAGRSVLHQPSPRSDMARLLLLPGLLAGLLVLVSTQQGSEACEVNGVSGTCRRLADCPENVAHHRAQNVSPLRAALSACKSPRQPTSRLLCCPSTSQQNVTTQQLARFQNHRLCGMSAFQPGRIVGGERVLQLQDFPWMAALQWLPEGSKPINRCGGAVINERWVLTAAHCITDGGPVSVRTRDLVLGTVSDDDIRSPPEEVPVSRTFRHPDYRRVISRPSGGLFSDIALLKLEKDLVFSDISKPLCLPERQRSTADYERLRRSYIAGWGLTEFGGVASPSMMWAGVNITNHRACQQSYRRRGVVSVDADEHLCANGNDLDQRGCDPGARDGSCRGGVDACEGDSGGPLMLRVENGNRQRWEVIGVISFGTGCGHPDRPGIYSRVDHFLDWIAETVASN